MSHEKLDEKKHNRNEDFLFFFFHYQKINLDLKIKSIFDEQNSHDFLLSTVLLQYIALKIIWTGKITSNKMDSKLHTTTNTIVLFD